MDLNLLELKASTCEGCELHTARINPVFAKGNPKSKVMICGMVPAHEENKVGTPFVGRAGKLLDTILSDIGWTTDNVYITNLVKCCLAPGISLKAPWMDACFPYLMVQIDLIKPKYIITLGKDSSLYLLNLPSNTPMSKIKGKEFEYGPGTKVIPTYHPSYLLRGGGVKHKNYVDTVMDFKKVQTKNLSMV